MCVGMELLVKVIDVLLPSHEENALLRIVVYPHEVLIKEFKNSMTEKSEMPMKRV